MSAAVAFRQVDFRAFDLGTLSVLFAESGERVGLTYLVEGRFVSYDEIPRDHVGWYRGRLLNAGYVERAAVRT